MTNTQLDMLKFIAKKPCTVSQIYKKFNLDYNSLISLMYNDFSKTYISFKRADEYEKSMLTLTLKGVDYVDTHNRETKRFIIPILISGILGLLTLIALVVQIILD